MSGPHAVGVAGVHARKGLLRKQMSPYIEEHYFLEERTHELQRKDADLGFRKNQLTHNGNPKWRGEKSAKNCLLAQLVENSMGSSERFRREEINSVEKQMNSFTPIETWRGMDSVWFLNGKI